MSYLVIDLETGSKKVYERVGNPWFNPVIVMGMKAEEESEPRTTEGAFEFFLTLRKTDLLIGHNIKFDLLHLWKHTLLQDAFRNGLQIWDTQLAEYILTGQRTKYAKLRTIAVEKYGCPERVKHIDEYFEKGIDTADIPRELVLADVKADVLDTEQVYLQQRETAVIDGVNTLIEFQMDALLATTEMEYNGMHINQETLKKNKLELELELEKTKEELEKLIKPYWR